MWFTRSRARAPELLVASCGAHPVAHLVADPGGLFDPSWRPARPLRAVDAPPRSVASRSVYWKGPQARLVISRSRLWRDLRHQLAGGGGRIDVRSFESDHHDQARGRAASASATHRAPPRGRSAGRGTDRPSVVEAISTTAVRAGFRGSMGKPYNVGIGRCAGSVLPNPALRYIVGYPWSASMATLAITPLPVAQARRRPAPGDRRRHLRQDPPMRHPPRPVPGRSRAPTALATADCAAGVALHRAVPRGRRAGAGPGSPRRCLARSRRAVSTAAAFNYAEALQKSLLFYEAQHPPKPSWNRGLLARGLRADRRRGRRGRPHRAAGSTPVTM